MAGFRHGSLLPWAAVILSALLSFPAPAAQRVALVIGNATYAHVPALANPLNDAKDVGAALDRLGFAVTRLENADRASLWRGLQEFALAASASEIAVVFYAGHGIEVDQRNFLVPVDARLASDQDVEFEGGAAGAGVAGGGACVGAASGDSGCMPREPVCGADAARGSDAFDWTGAGAGGAVG